MKLFLLLSLILLVSQGRKIIKKHVKGERHSRQPDFDPNQLNSDELIDKFSESEIQISEHLTIGEDIIDIINKQTIEYESQTNQQQQQLQQEDITSTHEQSDQIDLEQVEFDQLLQQLANENHDIDVEIPFVEEGVVWGDKLDEQIETKPGDQIQHQQDNQQNSDQIEQFNDANAQNNFEPIPPIVLEEQIQHQEEVKQSEQVELQQEQQDIPIQVNQIDQNDQQQTIEINGQVENEFKEEVQQEQIPKIEELILQVTDPQLENQVEDIPISQDNQQLESQKLEEPEQVVNQHQVIHQDTQNGDQIINQQDVDQEIHQITIESTQENSQQTDQATIQQTDEQIQVQEDIPQNQEQPITKDQEDVVIEDNINTAQIIEENFEQLEVQENEPIVENNEDIQNQDVIQQQEQEQTQKNEEINETLDEQLNQQSEQISTQNLDQEVKEDIQIIPEQIREENQDQIPEIVQEEYQNEINNNDQIEQENQQDQENILIDPHANEYANNGHLNHDDHHHHDHEHHHHHHYDHDDHHHHYHTQDINNEILNNQSQNENQNDSNPTDPNNSISQQPSCSFENKLSCSGDTHTQYSTGVETENQSLNKEELLQYLITHSYLQYSTNYPMYFFGILANAFLFSLVILKNLFTKKQIPYSTQISNELYNEDNGDNSQLQFQINQLDTTLLEINTKLDTLTKSYQKMQKDHQLINQIINDLQTKVLANLEKRKLKESCKSLNESNEDDAGVRQKRTQTQTKPRQRPTTPIQRQY
ncbi:unnamed protein product [Paramecium octaurelia]|uniref:Transmembrane protein n=1 Tax=Paramecium octaurelia TaxID=43137 RepID=A0A8S1VWI5_PAROT|nr:unnamed protein product [Paramecium octaurelia]